MARVIERLIRRVLTPIGLDVVQLPKGVSVKSSCPSDFADESIRICTAVKDFTMTSPERINALVEAVRYLVRGDVDGAFVECGVWKGGSSMAMILALQSLDNATREIWLYDTYEGMSAPSEADVSISGEDALGTFSRLKTSDDASDWCKASIEVVTRNLLDTGYGRELLHFVKGKVQDTIPKDTPDKIALLRLDTDWYESTRHELLHLFPRIQPGGVLIIDDYGHWKGARKAVDEYIESNGISILLNRIDYTGRIGVIL